ncbi:MAG: DUF2934 domain-containing protein [Rhodospirillales bacterium]
MIFLSHRNLSCLTIVAVFGRRVRTATDPQGELQMTQDQPGKIEQRAYEIWEREGRPEGKALEHWQQAIEEIAREEKAAASASGSKKKEAKSKKAAAASAGTARAASEDERANKEKTSKAKATKPKKASTKTKG